MSSKEQLKHEIIYNKNKTDSEWLDLEKRIIQFMNSNADQEEKDDLGRYTEMVIMVCSGIRRKNSVS